MNKDGGDGGLQLACSNHRINDEEGRDCRPNFESQLQNNGRGNSRSFLRREVFAKLVRSV